MTLVNLTGGTEDVTGRAAGLVWKFSSVVRSGSGDNVVVEKVREVRPAGGRITVQLEPGPCIIQHNDHTWLCTIPEQDCTLWEVIEAAVAFPPDTAQELLDAAVLQYVITHRQQFRTHAALVDPDDPDSLVQWYDENGDPIGDPVEQWTVNNVALQGIATGGGDGQIPAVADGGLVAVNPIYIDPTRAPYNVKPDRYTTTAASMSSSSSPTQLTVSGYTFTAADIGKVIKVAGAGSGGANLKTTITGVSSGKAVLGASCQTTVSNAYCVFGTDNHDALQALFNDLSFGGRGRKLSRTAIFPAGACLFSGTLVFPRRGTVKGAAENFVGHDIIYGAQGNGAEDQFGTTFHQMWDQNCDGFHFPDPLWAGDVYWQGKLGGFAVLQDSDNTAGKGINFVNSSGTPITVIDGGQIDYVSALGWAEEGFNFAGGSLPGTFKYLLAFACGYEKRKDFTCDTANGSNVLTNVSSTTGLAVGDILTSKGLPVDTIVTAVDAGASTVNIGRVATATAAGVAVQRLGAPGIRYKVWGEETLHFDCPSGDQNAGGLLRIEGPGGTYGSPITITALKNEFGCNVYKESRLDSVTFDGNYSVPQGLNAIVLNGVNRGSISIRGLTHWADATSSVGGTYPNPLGRDIGAAILDLNNGTAADVSWESLVVRGAPGSGQTVFYAFRDSRSVNILPIAADFTGKGTNRRKAKSTRLVADANATVSVHDTNVVWSSLTAARTAALPAISAQAAGTEVTLMDGSGSASGSLTITATPNGADTIVGDSAITNPYGELRLVSDGTKWIGRNIQSTRFSIIRDSYNKPIILFTDTSAAVNYLGMTGAITGDTPRVKAQGSDTNVSLALVPQGTGGVQIVAGTGVTPRLVANGPDTNHDLNLQSKGTGKIKANGVEVVDLSSAQTLTTKTLTTPIVDSIKDANGVTILTLNPNASAVNNIQVSNGAAGSPPQVRSIGADTNISLLLFPKGTGGVQIYAETGQTPRITAVGADANHDLNLQSKGTGKVKANGVEVVDLTTAQTQTNKTFTDPKITTIKDANGNTALNLPATASAVNYLELGNAAAGGAVQISAKGSDTNIHFLFQPKGTGAVQLYAAAGITPRLLAAGADTDVSLNLQTKGAGTVQINSNPAGVKVAVPASASAAGVPGQWAADASYHYVCTAANTWVRHAVATW